METYTEDVFLDFSDLKNEDALDLIIFVEARYPTGKLDYRSLDEKIEKINSTMISNFKNCALVHGAPGTGKTTLAKRLILNLNRQGITRESGLTIVAPTGKAATLLEGTTIHSFFGLGTKSHPDLLDSITLDHHWIITHSRKIEDISMLIIDEISMVSDNLLDLMDQILRRVKRLDVPFGGVKVIMFGDFLQLPPVNTQNKYQKYKNGYCFYSKVWNEVKPIHFMMFKVHRQSDTEFLRHISSIRRGVNCAEANKFFENLKHTKISDKAIKLRPTNKKVAEINRQELNKLYAQPHYYSYSFNITGEGYIRNISQDDIESYIDKNLNIDKELTYKLGARVMMVANDPEKRFINGSTGTISSILHDEYISILLDNGIEVDVYPMEFEMNTIENKKQIKLASVTQYPFVIGYACTFHKSQGMTFEEADVELSNYKLTDDFNGSVLVALSRVKTPQGLKLRNFNPEKHLLRNKIVAKYFSWVKHRDDYIWVDFNE